MDASNFIWAKINLSDHFPHQMRKWWNTADIVLILKFLKDILNFRIYISGKLQFIKDYIETILFSPNIL